MRTLLLVVSLAALLVAGVQSLSSVSASAPNRELHEVEAPQVAEEVHAERQGNRQSCVCILRGRGPRKGGGGCVLKRVRAEGLRPMGLCGFVVFVVFCRFLSFSPRIVESSSDLAGGGWSSPHPHGIEFRSREETKSVRRGGFFS